jgi:hypothetical protein
LRHNRNRTDFHAAQHLFYVYSNDEHEQKVNSRNKNKNKNKNNNQNQNQNPKNNDTSDVHIRDDNDVLLQQECDKIHSFFLHPHFDQFNLTLRRQKVLSILEDEEEEEDEYGDDDDDEHEEDDNKVDDEANNEKKFADLSLMTWSLLIIIIQ